MPYRIEIRPTSDAHMDRLIELGALDVEATASRITALMPDRVSAEEIATVLGVTDLAVTPAEGRDADSTWVLSPRAIQVGRIRIVPAGESAQPDDVQLLDSKAFGTGLHATTALCLETIDDEVGRDVPRSVLDVGTGSGILALAALKLGVPAAAGIDLDDEAIRAATANARLNGVHDRLRLERGGPETLTGTWPLVLANVLAAPLIEMAPALVQRVGHHGHLVLSGIPASVEADVRRVYRRLGMHHLASRSRDGWVALLLRASW